MAEGIEGGTSDGHQGDRAASPGQAPVDHLATHRSKFLKGGGRLQHDEGHLLAIPFFPHNLDGSTSQKDGAAPGVPCSKMVSPSR